MDGDEDEEYYFIEWVESESWRNWRNQFITDKNYQCVSERQRRVAT